MEGTQAQQSRAVAIEALRDRRKQQLSGSKEQQEQTAGGAGPLTAGCANEQVGAANEASMQPRRMRCMAWRCSTCAAQNGNGVCLPIRSESRCMCGHRLKDHAPLNHSEGAGVAQTLKCKAARCSCADFFYIVAEGSWILRCSCKHKHTDHDPLTHACSRPACSCGRFHSPWVCNCDHPWADHQQVIEEKEIKSLEQLGAELCTAADVNRHDLIQRGVAE